MDEMVGVIPAAGMGKRLYPFSKAVPKEMYPILGKAVIEHAIENLKEAGIKKIFIIVGYQKGALMDYVGDGSAFGIDVAYIYQQKRLGLGHAVLQAKRWIDKTFIVLLGDSFIEPKEEAKRLVEVHLKEKPLATILLFRVNKPEMYGIVKMRGKGSREGLITDVVEKPKGKEAKGYEVGNNEYYAICGMYIFEPEIFSYIEKTGKGASGEVQLTDAIGLAIKDGKKVIGVELRGGYMDIGKWETVLRVEKSMFKMYNLESIIRERNEAMRRFEKDGD